MSFHPSNLFDNLPLGVKWTLEWDSEDRNMLVTGEFPNGLVLSNRLTVSVPDAFEPEPIRDPSFAMRWLCDLFCSNSYRGYEEGSKS